MKIKEGFTLRTICGEHVVIGEGLSQVNFNKMLSLNATAAYLWEELKDRDFTVEDMVTLLTGKYEVSAELARQDAVKLLQVWQEQGVVQE